MAQYAINFDGGIATLQKDIASAEDAMDSLSKQAQGLADSVAELFSSIAPDKLMGQVEKTVKRITTTVRKETKKALLAFDEIERIGEESSKTTTTSVTTTTTDTANVDDLTDAFTLLEEAIAGALGAVESATVVEELAAIRVAAEGLFSLFSGQTFVQTWLGNMGSVTGGINGVLAALGTLAAFPAAAPVSLITLAIQGLVAAVGLLPGGWNTASAAITGVLSFLPQSVQNMVTGICTNLGSLEINVGTIFSGIGSALQTAFSGIGAFLGGFFTGIGTMLMEKFPGIGTYLGEFFVGLGETLQEDFSGIGSALSEFFSNLGTTIKEKCSSIGTSIQETFTNAGDFLSLLFSTVGTLAKEAFGGITGFLKDVFSKDFADSFGTIGGILDGFLANAKSVIAAVKGVFSGVISFFENAFSGDWSDAWDSVVSIFKSIWNGIKAVAKSPINVVIGYINGLVSGVVAGVNAVITALNTISFDVPSWVPVLGGKSFGFSLATLKTPKIPYLAEGAVLPANKPFMAVVGDQKNGTNVEAPLDTIKQALQEVMQQGNQQIVLNFTGDLAQLGRVLRPVISAENRRVGTSLVRKGAL